MACVISTLVTTEHHTFGNVGNLFEMTNNKLTCKKPCIVYGMKHKCLDMSVYHFEMIKYYNICILFVIVATRSKNKRALDTIKNPASV